MSIKSLRRMCSKWMWFSPMTFCSSVCSPPTCLTSWLSPPGWTRKATLSPVMAVMVNLDSSQCMYLYENQLLSWKHLKQHNCIDIWFYIPQHLPLGWVPVLRILFANELSKLLLLPPWLSSGCRKCLIEVSTLRLFCPRVLIVLMRSPHWASAAHRDDCDSDEMMECYRAFFNP